MKHSISPAVIIVVVVVVVVVVIEAILWFLPDLYCLRQRTVAHSSHKDSGLWFATCGGHLRGTYRYCTPESTLHDMFVH
jgi:hypothetical protein